MTMFRVVNKASFLGKLERFRLIVFHGQSGQYSVTTLPSCIHHDTEKHNIGMYVLLQLNGLDFTLFLNYRMSCIQGESKKYPPCDFQ